VSIAITHHNSQLNTIRHEKIKTSLRSKQNCDHVTYLGRDPMPRPYMQIRSSKSVRFVYRKYKNIVITRNIVSCMQLIIYSFDNLLRRSRARYPLFTAVKLTKLRHNYHKNKKIT